MGEWSDGLKKALSAIEKMQPDDRLSLLRDIATCNAFVAGSTVEWYSKIMFLYNVNPSPSETELREILSKFREFALQFLKFELEVTKKILQGYKEKQNSKFII